MGKEIVKHVIINIISGLITITIGMVIGYTFHNTIKPTIDQILYKGPSIHPKWEGKIDFPDGTYNKMRVNLSRYGYNVTGNAECTDGYSKNHTYEIDGIISPPLISATFRDLLPQSNEHGSALLVLTNDGNMLKGVIIYPDDTEDTIISTECVFNKSIIN